MTFSIFHITNRKERKSISLVFPLLKKKEWDTIKNSQRNEIYVYWLWCSSLYHLWYCIISINITNFFSDMSRILPFFFLKILKCIEFLLYFFTHSPSILLFFIFFIHKNTLTNFGKKCLFLQIKRLQKNWTVSTSLNRGNSGNKKSWTE